MKSLIIILIALSLPNGYLRAATSDLWGDNGKSWTAKSRLPDFSYAGYGGGRKPVPQLPVKADVRNFGAKGDGVADDSDAFIAAIAAVNEGAVLIPKGRYRITKVLKIAKRGVVLKGEGIDTTILLFPNSLSETIGQGKKHAPGGSWSWSGAFVSFEGEDKPLSLGKIILPAARGDDSLTVSTTAAIVPGQWVRLLLTNTDGSLARYIYGGRKDVPRNSGLTKLVDYTTAVTSIAGNRIILERPLKTDVLLKWKPEIWAYNPTVRDVGIENMTIEFPAVQYTGHHDEPGYNAIAFEGVSHGWVRNVLIKNADNGVFLRDRTKFCTIDSVRFSVDAPRYRTGYGTDLGEPRKTMVSGHQGILIANSHDNLVTDFQVDCRFIHDLSVSAWSTGNVFSKGSGRDIDIDHHRRGPYENLFTEIKAGEGTRLWQSGGDEEDGPHSGIRETFWNIQTTQPQTLPPWSLQGNYIGITSQIPAQRSESGDWWEPIPTERLSPSNLYIDQITRARKLIDR